MVIGGTLLAGGRGGVWGTLAGVLLFATLDAAFNMLGVSAYPKLVLRGAIVILAVAVLHVPRSGTCRMTVAIQGGRERARAVALVRRVNFAVVVFLALYVAVGLLQPTYLEPAGAMNFLRRAAPLAILASGQLFVLVSGGFDLSVGSLVTLTVIGGSMLTANDPSKTWSTIAVLYAIGLFVGLINGAVVAYLKTPVDHRDARDAAVGQRRGDDVVRRLAARISARQFSHVRTVRVPRRAGHQDLSARDRGPRRGRRALAHWGLHATVFGRRVFAVGDNPRAAELAGVRVEFVRLGVFVISALSAVTAGVLLGGFGGVSVDVGRGLELQAIAACVVGGVQLMGGRGTVVGAVAGALTFTALFTLLTLLGWPQPLKETAQGFILIAAVAIGAWRRRRAG